MSKLCSNCGFSMEDNDRFCPVCGTAVASEVPAEPAPVEEPVVAENPAEPQKAPYTPPYKPYPRSAEPASPAAAAKKKNPLKKILTIAITLLIVGVIGFVAFFVMDNFGLFGNFTYKGAVKNYVQFYGYGKTELLKDLAPKEFWDYLEEEDGVDFDEAQEIIDKKYEDFDEMIEEEYGEDYKVKYKTKSKSEVSKSKLKKIAKALKEDYDIKSSKVTKGYKLKLEVSFSGSEDEGEEDLTVYVLKISGKWYLVDVDEYGGSYYVSFIIE